MKVIIPKFANKLSGSVFKKSLSTIPIRKPDYVVFPREKEGNIYMDNWSLVNDGVTPVGDLFRNGRSELLQSRLKSKIVNGKFDSPSLVVSNEFEIKEAGDNISHESFTELLSAKQQYLSSGIDLYVEDGAVIASKDSRIGVRIVTDKPEVALIAKSLLVIIVFFSLHNFYFFLK